jgi:hypothetical protein
LATVLFRWKTNTARRASQFENINDTGTKCIQYLDNRPAKRRNKKDSPVDVVKRFYWSVDETTEFCKLCVQMIQKGDLEQKQPSLNDEAAESLSRELVGTLEHEIPIKKLKRDKWRNMMQLYVTYF